MIRVLAMTMRRLLSAVTHWRVMAPLAAVHVLTVASAALGLHAIAREVDRSDSLRAGEAVAAAFDHQLSRLEMSTVNNAVYTEAWKAVGGARVNKKWAIENWTVAPPDLPGYHGILLLEPDGRPIVGTRAGRPLTTSAMLEMATLVRPTTRKLPVWGAVSTKGLITTGSTPILVAAANVVPEPDDQTSASLRGPKRRLVLINRVNVGLLATMNQTIGGEELKLAAPGQSSNEVVLKADAGGAVALTWRSRQPGQAAMIRSLRIIAPVTLLVTLLLIIAMKTGLTSNRALRRAATIDQLTGLLNRAAFSTELGQRIAKGRRFVLELIDLDGFKEVNDQHGHLVGDDLLKEFAAILRNVAEPSDIVGRLGGDEFAFLCQDQQAADRLAVRLQLELSTPVGLGTHVLLVAASIGTAPAESGSLMRDVMGSADAELYVDKRRRRATRLAVAQKRTARRRASGAVTAK